MTTPKDRNEKLIQEIESIFLEGLNPDSDVWDFINSGYSDPSPEELSEILADPENHGAEPVMELLFFPDERVQARLEPLLEAEAFEPADEKIISSELARRRPFTHLTLPSGSDLQFYVPDWASEGFVRRLHIAKRLDPILIEAVERAVDPSQRTPFKVRLRNSSFPQTKRTVGFIRDFLDRIVADPKDLALLMDDIIEFLNEIQDTDDIYGALMDKKKFYFRMLQTAQKFERQLKKHNIETLLMQGIRSPHVDQADVRRRMAAVDRISYAVFGKTEYLDEIQGSMDFDIDEDEDLETVIRSLS